MIDVEYEAKQKEIQKRNKMATKIQALFRGYRGRVKFELQKPELKRQQGARVFCVECEIVLATKRCRVCKDRYCDNCYAQLHRKGKRLTHTFDILRGNNNGQIVDMNANPMLWNEYWDANARAKYWYHSITGEATWICPY